MDPLAPCFTLAIHFENAIQGVTMLPLGPDVRGARKLGEMIYVHSHPQYQIAEIRLYLGHEEFDVYKDYRWRGEVAFIFRGETVYKQHGRKATLRPRTANPRPVEASVP